MRVPRPIPMHALSFIERVSLGHDEADRIGARVRPWREGRRVLPAGRHIWHAQWRRRVIVIVFLRRRWRSLTLTLTLVEVQVRLRVLELRLVLILLLLIILLLRRVLLLRIGIRLAHGERKVALRLLVQLLTVARVLLAPLLGHVGLIVSAAFQPKEICVIVILFLNRSRPGVVAMNVGVVRVHGLRTREKTWHLEKAHFISWQIVAEAGEGWRIRQARGQDAVAGRAVELASRSRASLQC